MFNFFKRKKSVGEELEELDMRFQTPKPVARQDRRSRSALDPLPVPEVIEGNEDSDWDRWHDSVMSQHGQLDALETKPGHLEKIRSPDQEKMDEIAADVFAQISRNSN